MDGGVANNAPLAHAIDLGADLVYALPAAYACGLRKPPASALGMACARGVASGSPAAARPGQAGDTSEPPLSVDGVREHVMVFLQVLANLEQSRDALAYRCAQLLG